MTWEGWLALGVVALCLYALAKNLASTDTVLLGAITIFMALNLVSDKFPSAREMLAEFGNEGLATVGALFVVAAGLTETGALSLISDRMLGRPRSVASAQLRMMLPAAGLSTVINNTPVVAVFVPIVNDWCKKIGVSPSKIFIPLSYATILGGCCTLVGTSTNLVVHGMMVSAARTDPTMPTFSFLTLAWVGVPAAIVGIAYILIASKWLLPDRHGRTTATDDPREYTIEMTVQPGSPIDGMTVESAGLRNLPGAFLIEIDRKGEILAAVGPQQRLRGDDRLVFAGVVDSVVDLQKIRGLIPATNQVFRLAEPRHNRLLVEAVLSNACPIVGKSIRDGRFRTRYNAAVIAVHRNGERLDGKIGDIVLRTGDALLLEAQPQWHELHRNSKHFLLVSPVRDSAPVRHDRAWVALVIFGLVVVGLVLEQFIPVLTTALLGAGAMVATRCIRGDHARRSVDWSTLLAIGAAFGVGKTLEATGAATFVSDGLVNAFRPMGPWGVLAGVYLTTLIFTELVTNNAAAALAFPIARASAAALGVSFMPFAICIAVAASAGFATPLGYQTHLMVYRPGGYRFADFFRMGVPLDLLVMAVCVGLAPVFFPF